MAGRPATLAELAGRYAGAPPKGEPDSGKSLPPKGGDSATAMLPPEPEDVAFPPRGTEVVASGTTDELRAMTGRDTLEDAFVALASSAAGGHG